MQAVEALRDFTSNMTDPGFMIDSDFIKQRKALKDRVEELNAESKKISAQKKKAFDDYYEAKTTFDATTPQR